MKEAQALLRRDLRAALARRSLLGSRAKAFDEWFNKRRREQRSVADEPPSGRLAEINREDDLIRSLRGKLAIHARLLPRPARRGRSFAEASD